MRNPLRDEDAAFRVLLGSIAGLGLIAAGSWIDRWVGLAVLVALVVGGGAVIARATRAARVPRTAPSAGQPVTADADRRVLVLLASDPAGDGAAIDRACRGGGGAYVVVPALDTNARTWSAGRERAVGEAKERLEGTLAALMQAGMTARGAVGDLDLERAALDAARIYAPTELVVSGSVEPGLAASVGRRLGVGDLPTDARLPDG